MDTYMSPEEQRIKIAEACGKQTGRKLGNDVDAGWKKILFNMVPDYLNSLDAMYEAEKVLNEDQARLFNDLLFDSKDVSKFDGSVNDYVWHAEASHRAEVFLVTLGLWKDDASNLSNVDSRTASINKKE